MNTSTYSTSYYYTTDSTYPAYATATNGLWALSSASSIEINEKGGFLTIPLAGFSKNDVSITSTHDLIKIKAEKQGKSTYTNSFAIGDQLDSQKISASMKDGELKIEIPYKALMKPRNIQIQ